MKTNLNRTILTNQDAIDFLVELHRNGEAYHPEDDAHDIVWHHCDTEPSWDECEKLNDLMDDVYQNTNIDPCAVYLNYEMNGYCLNCKSNHFRPFSVNISVMQCDDCGTLWNFHGIITRGRNTHTHI